MFLESMTWKEVQTRILDSMDFLDRNTARNFSEWQKKVKRLRPLPLRFYKTVKNGHKDEFLLLGCSEDGKHLATGIYAISNTIKGKEFAKVDIDPYDDFPRDRVTTHFLQVSVRF